MARQSEAAKRTVARVMHEFKHGELESGSGGQVRNPRQAIAIGLSEAGVSRNQSPAQKRRAAARQGDGPTRRELYRQATERGIEGRSRMSKVELARALGPA